MQSPAEEQKILEHPVNEVSVILAQHLSVGGRVADIARSPGKQVVWWLWGRTVLKGRRTGWE